MKSEDAQTTMRQPNHNAPTSDTFRIRQDAQKGVTALRLSRIEKNQQNICFKSKNCIYCKFMPG